MSATYYSNCSSLTTGCYLYTNTCLTSPVSNGYYSDGSSCYTISGGGYISSVSSCSVTYYTYADKYTCVGTSCTWTGITEIIAAASAFSFGSWYYQSATPFEAWQATITTVDPGYAVPFMFYGPEGSCPLNCFNEA